jgi:hypothetical protein
VCIVFYNKLKCNYLQLKQFFMLFDITTLIAVVKEVYERLSSRRNDTIEALGAVRQALNYTYNYLYNTKGDYIPNMELATLWNIASTMVMRVNMPLGDLLANKSRFWTHPDIYDELNRKDEIPTLKEITDEMERLRIRIGH